MSVQKRSNYFIKGAVNLLILLGIAITTIALPVVTRLVQKRQELRTKAYYVGGKHVSCPPGTTQIGAPWGECCGCKKAKEVKKCKDNETGIIGYYWGDCVHRADNCNIDCPPEQPTPQPTPTSSPSGCNQICRSVTNPPVGNYESWCQGNCRCRRNDRDGNSRLENPWCDADTKQYVCRNGRKTADPHGQVSGQNKNCPGDPVLPTSTPIPEPTSTSIPTPTLQESCSGNNYYCAVGCNPGDEDVGLRDCNEWAGETCCRIVNPTGCTNPSGEEDDTRCTYDGNLALCVYNRLLNTYYWRITECERGCESTPNGGHRCIPQPTPTPIPTATPRPTTPPRPTSTPTPDPNYHCDGNNLMYRNIIVETCQYGCNPVQRACNPPPTPTFTPTPSPTPACSDYCYSHSQCASWCGSPEYKCIGHMCQILPTNTPSPSPTIISVSATPTPDYHYRCDGNVLLYNNVPVETCQYGCDPVQRACNPAPADCTYQGQTYTSGSSRCNNGEKKYFICEDGSWKERNCPNNYRCYNNRCVPLSQTNTPIPTATPTSFLLSCVEEGGQCKLFCGVGEKSLGRKNCGFLKRCCVSQNIVSPSPVPTLQPSPVSKLSPTLSPKEKVSRKCLGNQLIENNLVLKTCKWGCNPQTLDCNPVPKSLKCTQEGEVICQHSTIKKCQEGIWKRIKFCGNGCSQDGRTCLLFNCQPGELKCLDKNYLGECKQDRSGWKRYYCTLGCRFNACVEGERPPEGMIRVPVAEAVAPGSIYGYVPQTENPLDYFRAVTGTGEQEGFGESLTLSYLEEIRKRKLASQAWQEATPKQAAQAALNLSWTNIPSAVAITSGILGEVSYSIGREALNATLNALQKVDSKAFDRTFGSTEYTGLTDPEITVKYNQMLAKEGYERKSGTVFGEKASLVIKTQNPVYQAKHGSRVIINPAKDPALQAFMRQVHSYVANTRSSLSQSRVPLVEHFVNRWVAIKDVRARQKIYQQNQGSVLLGEFAKQHTGVCRECALLTHAGLAAVGKPSRVVTANIKGGSSRHAWVEVTDSRSNQIMVVDSTWGFVLPAEQAYQRYGGVKDKIERVFLVPQINQ